MTSQLPPKPDFDSLEAQASRSAAQRTHKLALIGNLNFSWSNNESMFIYMLMLLLEDRLQLRRHHLCHAEHDAGPGSTWFAGWPRPSSTTRTRSRGSTV